MPVFTKALMYTLIDCIGEEISKITFEVNQMSNKVMVGSKSSNVFQKLFQDIEKKSNPNRVIFVMPKTQTFSEFFT